MIKTLLATAAVVAPLALPAHAVTLVQWNFDSVTAPSGTSTSWTGIAASTGTGTASGTHNAATTWTTPAGNGSTKSISSNTWSVGSYWQFSFGTTGFADLLLSFDQIGSSTGPRDFTLSYSTDGTTFTNFANYSITSAPSWSSSTPQPVHTYSFDLSAVAALDNKSSVLLRLVDASTTAINGGTVASGGTGRVDNFTVMMTPVPEPGTSAMLLAGLAALGFMARRRRG